MAAFALLAGCDTRPYPADPPGRKVIHLSLTDEPSTLDPSASLSPTIDDSVYPAYFEYDYVKRPTRLRLALGAREPVVRRIGKIREEWTFHLRRGIRFADDPCFSGGKGREATAADVLFSLKRMADPSISAPYFSYLENRIVGFADYAKRNRERMKRGQGADFDAPVEGMRLKDRYTFQLILDEPFPQLRYIMALRCATPQAREAWAMYGKDLRRYLVGTGPFRLKEYRPKQRIVLERNLNFVPNPDSPYRPKVDEISYSIVREGISSWNRFLQGYEDAWTVSPVNYRSVMARPGELSPDMQRRGVQIARAQIPNYIGFLFNMDDPTFGRNSESHRKLRQAISLAIDREALIELFTLGAAERAEFLVPPTLDGYDPAYRNPYGSLDLVRAKTLLAEAGYPGGIDPKTGERLKLNFDYVTEDSSDRQFVALVKRQIGALGIEVVGRPWRSVVLEDRKAKGQWQFIPFMWFADYPDPEMFLLTLYGPNRRPGMNLCDYENPEVDRLFERVRAMADGPERAGLIHRLRDRVVEDCPIVYVRHNRSLLLSQPWIHDRVPPEVDADMTRYWSVDTADRERRTRDWNRPSLAPALGLAAVGVIGAIPALLTVRRRGRRTLRG